MDGIVKGVLVGENNKALEIAKKMKTVGMDAKTIHEMTGLDLSEVD